MKRKLVQRDKEAAYKDLIEISIESINIPWNDERRDEELTLWNIVLDYVADRWPDTKINHNNANGICVVGIDVIIGKKEYNAVDPSLFKYIDDACRKGTTISKGSRRLKSKWSLEAAEDLMAIHGLDIEKNLVENIKKDLRR